jgi:hypothetical protein
MTFERGGFQKLESGVTPDALTLLAGLSQKHEAEASANAAPWGQKGRFEEPELRRITVFTDPVEQALLKNSGCARDKLFSSIAWPQMAYSFQTDQNGLALLQHIDGAEDGPKTAAEYEILVGVLLSNVVSMADGAFVLWPGTHYSGREFMKQHPRMPAWNAIREIPKATSRPKPFLGSVGDVILMHRLVQHGTAARSTPGVRRMAFFRLGFVWHAENTPVEKTGFAR